MKAGTTFGATDEYGYFAIENKVHVHDLHATILHLFGLDHTKLTYPFSGRNMRLTDVHGRVQRSPLMKENGGSDPVTPGDPFVYENPSPRMLKKGRMSEVGTAPVMVPSMGIA